MLSCNRILRNNPDLILLILSFAIPCAGLKTISNPQGGKIVYGQVQGQATEAGAMGAILHSLHLTYGDKPQVGKVFEVRRSDSVAVFLTLVKRNQGNAKIAGMIIASKSLDNHIEAALLSDDADRFASTINPMLKKLFSEWYPAGNSHASQSSSSSSGSVALRSYSLPDRSASVSLPVGWKVEPSSGMGTIIADGPNGEAVALGYAYLASDTNNPAVQRTMNTLRNGGLRNTAYAKALYYPYGGDLAKTFVDLAHMTSKRNGKPAADFRISSETQMQPRGNLRCAHLLGQADPHDGKAKREINTVFCSSPPGRFGS